MNRIKSFIGNLNDREKKLLSVAGLLVLIVIMNLMLKNMGFLFQSSVGQAVTDKKNDYIAIQPKIIELQKLMQQQNDTKKIQDGKLFELINSNKPVLSTAEDELPVIKLVNDNDVKISYKAVSFFDLIIWLGRQQKLNGITVIKADIQRNEEQSGYVSAEIVLG